MNKLIEFELEDGSTILVESNDRFSQGENVYISNDVEIEKAERKFSSSMDSIRSIAKTSLATISSLGKKPEEFTLEFGLKLTGKTNAILVSGELESNIKVTLKWKNEDSNS